MNCSNCNASNPPGAASCIKCHAPLGADEAQTLDGMPESRATPVTVGVAEPAAASLTVLKPGSVLGARYEILGLLGVGGMGAVYKARDREVDRLVVLKVIRPELAGNPEILQRFKQELILARQITHKNVIRIFDLGEAEGIKFISMEYIEGKDLRTALTERGKFPPEEAAETIRQVSDALEAAHSEGVVHRDLKPQNIMVDKLGKVTVMDFGIARSMEQPGMTQTGAIIGTPEYMSPEQAKGEETDARSDLFSLGIIFYELLTGKTPYHAPTAVAMLVKRTQERATPPVKLDPAIPKYLNDVVVKCLEIDRKDRYQKASEIAADLEAHHAPRAGPLTLRMPRFRTVEEVPTKWLGPGLAALMLVIFVIVFRGRIFERSGKSGPAGPVVSVAILPFHNASGDASLDWLETGLPDMLKTDMGQSAHLHTVSSDTVAQALHDLRVTPGSALDPGTFRRVAEFTNADKLVWGQVSKLGDRIRIDATLRDPAHERNVPLQVESPSEKELPSAIAQLAQAIQKDLSLSPDIMKELQAQAWKPSTNSLQALRDYNEGLELARRGKNLEALKKLQASTQDDPQFALAYSRLGQVEANLGYDSDAEAASRQAVELSEKLPTQERYLILAIHARIMKDYPKAIEAYENLAKAMPGDTDIQFTLAGLYEDSSLLDKAREHFANVLKAEPQNARALLSMGRVEIRSGNPQGALDNLNRALTLAIQLENQEQRGLTLQVLAVAYQLLNKPDDALGYFQQSLEVKRRLNDKLGIADSLGGIAQVQASKGQMALALKTHLEAIQIRREIGDKKGLGDSLIDLGDVYSRLGQYDEVLKKTKEALEIEHEVGNKTNEALALNDIGNAYLAKGQYEDARTYFEKALRLRQELKVPNDIAATLHNLGETSLNLGEYDQASNYYLRALELRRTAGDQEGEAEDSDSLAILFSYQGQYGGALKAEEDALNALRQAHEGGFWIAEIMSDEGRALNEVGRPQDAQKVLDEAMRLAREIGNQDVIAQTLNFQGDRFCYVGDFEAAGRSYEEALRTASRTSDRRLILQTQLNRAKLAVRKGQASSAIGPLKSLGEEADSLGMKYLSVDASLYLAEALIAIHNDAQARTELERALARSEKMGLRGLLARGHFLMATALRLAGHAEQSGRELEKARQILSDIRKEAGDSVIKRSDFAPIVQQPS